MFPWFWLWAPQLHLPWSGNVQQDIEPSTSWFFAGIAPQAGNARIEQQAFGVASYGRQLGLLTDVLIDLAEQSAAPRAAEADRALAELRRIRSAIDALKDSAYADELQAVEARAAELRGKMQARQRTGAARPARPARRLAGKSNR